MSSLCHWIASIILMPLLIFDTITIPSIVTHYSTAYEDICSTHDISCGGQSQSFAFQNARCGCDNVCHWYGDCCWDKANHSSVEYTTSWKCISGYLVIDACPLQWSDSNVSSLCAAELDSDGNAIKDPLTMVPVTSATTGLAYQNYYCSLCHDDALSLKFWSVKLIAANHDLGAIWSNITTRSAFVWHLLEQGHLNESWEQWQIWGPDVQTATPDIALRFDPQPEINSSLRVCRSTVDTCSADWSDNFTQELCLGYTGLVQSDVDDDDDQILYRNAHCALCNGRNLTSLRCTELDHLSPVVNETEMLCLQKCVLKISNLLQFDVQLCQSWSPNSAKPLGYTPWSTSTGMNSAAIPGSLHISCQDTDLLTTNDSYSSDPDGALCIVTELASGLSIIGALLHCFIVVLMPRYRTLHCRMVGFLHFAVNGAGITILVLGARRYYISEESCKLLVGFFYYFSTVSPSLMSAMIFDDVWSIRKILKRKTPGSEQPELKFVIYSVCAWFGPTFLNLIPLSLKPSLSNGICYFSNRSAYVLCYEVPVFIMSFVISMMFLKGFHDAQAARGSTKIWAMVRELTNDLKRHLAIFGLTFLTTVAGSVFHKKRMTPKTLLFVLSLMNAIIGLVIFYLFTFKLCKNLYRMRKGKHVSFQTADIILH